MRHCSLAILAAASALVLACQGPPEVGSTGAETPAKAKTEAKSEVKAEAKSEAKAEAKSEAKAEAKSEAKPLVMTSTGVLSELEFAALHELTKVEPPAPRGVELELSSGAKAYLSLPEGATAPLPGVVVVHEWYGLNGHIRHWADRLASDGYAALAVDLYGGQVATTSDQAMTMMKAVDDTKARAALTAAHRFLAEDSRVKATKRGVIGWCFGGGWSLQQALMQPDLDAAVIYYGRLETDPSVLAKIEAPVLGVFGDMDEGIPPEAVQEFAAAMEQAGKSLELHRYEAPHAFANPSASFYDPKSAEDAWGKVRAFFAKHLRG